MEKSGPCWITTFILPMITVSTGYFNALFICIQRTTRPRISLCQMLSRNSLSGFCSQLFGKTMRRTQKKCSAIIDWHLLSSTYIFGLWLHQSKLFQSNLQTTERDYSRTGSDSSCICIYLSYNCTCRLCLFYRS